MSDFWDDHGGKIGGIGAGLGYLLGSRDSDAPGEGVQLGYQGEIPDYSLVREQVLDTSDPSMTPGAMGKRYFSDFHYMPMSDEAGISALRQDLFNQANVGPDSLRAQNYARQGLSPVVGIGDRGPTGINTVVGAPFDYSQRGITRETGQSYTMADVDDPNKTQYFNDGTVFIPGYGFINAYDAASMAGFTTNYLAPEYAAAQEAAEPSAALYGATSPLEWGSRASGGEYLANPWTEGTFLAKSIVDGTVQIFNTEADAIAFAGGTPAEGGGGPPEGGGGPPEGGGEPPEGGGEPPEGGIEGNPARAANFTSAEEWGAVAPNGSYIQPGAAWEGWAGGGYFIVKTPDGRLVRALDEAEAQRLSGASERLQLPEPPPHPLEASANEWMETHTAGEWGKLEVEGHDPRWIVRHIDGTREVFSIEQNAINRSNEINDELARIDAQEKLDAQEELDAQTRLDIQQEANTWAQGADVVGGTVFELSNGQFAVKGIGETATVHDTREAADAEAVVIQEALAGDFYGDNTAQKQVDDWLENPATGAGAVLDLGPGRAVVRNRDGSTSIFNPTPNGMSALQNAQAHSDSILAEINKEKEDARIAALEESMAGVEDHVPHQLEDGQWAIRLSSGAIQTGTEGEIRDIAWGETASVGDVTQLSDGQWAVRSQTGVTIGTEQEVRDIAEIHRKHAEGDMGTPTPRDDNTDTYVPPGWTREDWLAYLESISGGRFLNQGGLASLGYDNGGYLDGRTDGMADMLNTTIEGKQPAALSDGEFVVAADVVSHLGNGNSDAGAEQLYAMMDEIRMDRTGTREQGRQIDPNQYMPRGVA